MVESVWVEFKNRYGKVFKLAGIYRPPLGCSVGGISKSAEEVRMVESLMLEEMLRGCRNASNNIIILGDFNYRGIDWDFGMGDRDSERFLDVIEECGLNQMVKEPTREDSILDLLLVNYVSLIEEVRLGSTLGNSDHRMIWFQLNFEGKLEPNHAVVPDFRRANWRRFKEELSSINWDCVPG